MPKPLAPTYSWRGVTLYPSARGAWILQLPVRQAWRCQCPREWAQKHSLQPWGGTVGSRGGRLQGWLPRQAQGQPGGVCPTALQASQEDSGWPDGPASTPWLGWGGSRGGGRGLSACLGTVHLEGLRPRSCGAPWLAVLTPAWALPVRARLTAGPEERHASEGRKAVTKWAAAARSAPGCAGGLGARPAAPA